MSDVNLPESDCLEFITTHYAFAGPSLTHHVPEGKKAVIYGISIRNISDSPVRVIGRKWISMSSGGETEVTEGDHLFNSRPLLQPGQVFAVKGFHIITPPAKIFLTLIGRDNHGEIFQTPSFLLQKRGSRRTGA